MKQLTKVALLSALALALAGSAALAQNEPAGSQAPAGAPPGPGQHLLGLLDKYDANHDGQLDQSELAALRKDAEEGKLPVPQGMRGGRGPGGPGGQPGMGQPPKEILEKYDINKDGKLDETERAALHKDIQEGKIQPPAMARGGRGAGEAGQANRPTPANILAKFDADKDGKLDEAELGAFLKEMAEHRQGMGGGRRGPGGPGGQAPGENAPQP